jgi:hypothetical protein
MGGYFMTWTSDGLWALIYFVMLLLLWAYIPA